MFVIVIIALWIGSAIAGWYMFWPWLIVPVAVFSLHAARVTSGLRAARTRIGLPASGSGRPGTSMVGPNVQLITLTFLQHLAIFALGAGAQWLWA